MPDRRREGLVSAAFVALADTLTDHDPVEVMERLVGHTVGLLAVDGAAVILGGPAGPRVVASFGEDAELPALLQVELADGPIMDCLNTASSVSAPDLGTAVRRWPLAGPAVLASGFRSIDALPLRLRSETIGVLSLFRRSSGPLLAADLRLAHGLADVATIGLLCENAIRRGVVRNEQLQTALNSRVIIEQAKGVLACRTGLGTDTAFDRLRSHARSGNLRLDEVARRVVAGDLDLDARPGGD